MIYWNVDMMTYLNVDNNDVLKRWQNKTVVAVNAPSARVTEGVPINNTLSHKMMYLNADDIKWCIQKYDAYAQIFGRVARFRNKNDVFKT